MPAKKGVGLDEHKGVAPTGEHAGQSYKKDAVSGAEEGPPRSANGDGELMAKESILGEKFVGRAQAVGNEASGDAGGPATGGGQVHQGGSADGEASALPQTRRARKVARRHARAVPQNLYRNKLVPARGIDHAEVPKSLGKCG